MKKNKFLLIHLLIFLMVLIIKKYADNLLESDSVKLKSLLATVNNFDELYKNYELMPTIYVITPTYRRLEQLADLTLMKNTFWSVPKMVWILVEDSKNASLRIDRFLKESNLNYVHLYRKTPKKYLNKKGDVYKTVKGIIQRNVGLKWLRTERIVLENSVVYFADDDNRYSIELFDEIRLTKRVAVWPVAFSGNLTYEGPVCNNGKVIDFLTITKRKFPLDMSGFAINLDLIKKYPEVYFKHERNQRNDNLVSDFLSQIIQIEDLEAKADNCQKILVWHTNTYLGRSVYTIDGIIKRFNITYNKEIVENV